MRGFTCILDILTFTCIFFFNEEHVYFDVESYVIHFLHIDAYILFIFRKLKSSILFINYC